MRYWINFLFPGHHVQKILSPFQLHTAESVIAGRQGTGLVTVITPNGERVETKVTLGVTDGANIEILSGLEAVSYTHLDVYKRQGQG